MLAEHVLGRARSEPVDLEAVLAVEGLERGFVDDETLEACGDGADVRIDHFFVYCVVLDCR